MLLGPHLLLRHLHSTGQCGDRSVPRLELVNHPSLQRIVILKQSSGIWYIATCRRTCYMLPSGSPDYPEVPRLCLEAQARWCSECTARQARPRSWHLSHHAGRCSTWCLPWRSSWWSWPSACPSRSWVLFCCIGLTLRLVAARLTEAKVPGTDAAAIFRFSLWIGRRDFNIYF